MLFIADTNTFLPAQKIVSAEGERELRWISCRIIQYLKPGEIMNEINDGPQLLSFHMQGTFLQN
jgi:hypothetical protein